VAPARKYHAESEESKFKELEEIKWEEEKEGEESEDSEKPKWLHNYFNWEFEIAMKKHKTAFYSTATPYSNRGFITKDYVISANSLFMKSWAAV